MPSSSGVVSTRRVQDERIPIEDAKVDASRLQHYGVQEQPHVPQIQGSLSELLGRDALMEQIPLRESTAAAEYEVPLTARSCASTNDGHLTARSTAPMLGSHQALEQSTSGFDPRTEFD